MAPANFLSWYDNRLPRFIDLVGDYAGKELFLIEGDSLLRHCMEDDRLDFQDGFQMLHAVFIVEQFLENLIKRHCNFHLGFFDDQRPLCVPGSVKAERRSKYLLARTIIIRHLSKHLPASAPSVHVHVFSSISGPDFQEYLDSHPVHFVMSHDGALPAIGSVQKETHLGKVGKSILRGNIWAFNKLGMNVALVNRLEFRDSKAFTMIIEGGVSKHMAGDYSKAAEKNRQELLKLNNESSTTTKQMSDELDQLAIDSATRASRRLLIATIVKVLSIDPSLKSLVSAFLLHIVLQKQMPLSERRLAAVIFDAETEVQIESFIDHFASTAAEIMQAPGWTQAEFDETTVAELVDFVDGRLFRATLKAVSESDNLQRSLPKDILSEWEKISESVGLMSGVSLSLSLTLDEANPLSTTTTDNSENGHETAVMQFSHPAFDAHLDCIHINTDDKLSSQMAAMKMYRETTHWHNHRKPLNPKQQPEVKYSKWHNPLRTNQRYQAEMQTYAASLTNAKGKALEPETITINDKKLAPAPTVVETKPAKKEAASNKKTGKKAPALSRKEQIIQDNKEKKGGAEASKAHESWLMVMKNLDELSSDQDRFLRARAYLDGLDSSKLSHVGLDVSMYLVSALLTRWSKYCKLERKPEGLYVVALLWSTIRSIVTSTASLSKDAVQNLEKTCELIGISDALAGMAKPALDKKLSFVFKYPVVSQSLSIGMGQKEFQLKECGPYMDRYLDAQPDSRVSFIPDGWQRKVLDELEKKSSVFVVAPTSAGKTFIGFFAMEQILRENNDDVLVYVAPTKALVNQIAAEIQGRFSKKYPQAGKSVWAIHTRDYRVNNSTGCQILVTVPHVLQIMLMAPTNAKSWAPRVKRIIFDEIHSIGNAEDGVVWEQLLLLAPCPIIALSATVGNPEQFADWLAETQKASGTKLSMIQHSTRYSDLRKYLYEPPAKFEFDGLGTPKGVGLGLDGLTGLTFYHPVASLVDRSRGIPDDLAFEARDCFLLWQAMKRAATPEYKLEDNLDPEKCLPAVIKKADIFDWEKKLKTVLSRWMHDRASPFAKTVADLSPPRSSLDTHATKTITTMEFSESDSDDETASEATASEDFDKDDLLSTTLPLLYQLHQRHALPAILFNYDRTKCEDIAHAVLKQLTSAEDRYKESKEWKNKVEGFTKWKEAEAKKRNKKPPKVSKKSKGDDDDGEGPSKADAMRDAADVSTSPYDAFDPDAPQDAFSFADRKKAQASEIDVYIRQLRWKGVRESLIALLQRGIGVHHAGMNRKYRQCVEMLFRKQYLRIVVATGTLALGINMPCATVVFSGDSVFLTALNFRQAAGRAGRRGFDLLGNVVFQNITQDRVARLLSSRLPDLTGHFPITTSLVLRLFTLLSDSKNSPYAIKAVNSLLSQPRLYLGGESFKEQVLHHLRFSIEYLRRNALLGPRGQPLNFTPCVAHLYYTENSAFAFHALLKDGYFTKLCADIDVRGDQVMHEMMVTLSHIFGRQIVREVDDEDAAERIRRSPSMVYLEPLPKSANVILREHNRQTLSIFQTYVTTFAQQHCKDVENKLPLTGVEIGLDASESLSCIPSLPAPSARSTFVALSGHGDTFDTIEDLCSSSRSGVFLEAAVVPHLTLHPDESRTPLNAYLLDFFKHGSIVPLEKANGIRKSDVWFALNDFSMVLATITTSLANYLGLGNSGGDDELLDVMGGGDAGENEKDEEEAATSSGLSTASTLVNQPIGTPPVPGTAVRKTKKKVADDWDDAEDAQAAEDEWEENFSAVSEKDKDEEYDELFKVYRAFSKLKKEFDAKFFEIFA